MRGVPILCVLEPLGAGIGAHAIEPQGAGNAYASGDLGRRMDASEAMATDGR